MERAPWLRQELPAAAIPMILVFGPGFTIHDPAQPGTPGRPLPRSFVAGLHERATHVGSRGTSLCLQVDFTPLGARRFLGLPLGGILGGVFDLNVLLGAEIDRLEARLAETPHWAGRFAVVEAALLDRIARAAAPHPLLPAAWARLAGVRPQRRGLAEALECSRQHLVTLFRREVGLPPRTLGRLIRFERAMARLERGEGMIMLGSPGAGSAEFDRAQKTPSELGGTTQSPYLVVADADAVYARARTAGAEIVIAIKDEAYGGRGFSCRDPEGHLWHVGTYDPWRRPAG